MKKIFTIVSIALVLIAGNVSGFEKPVDSYYSLNWNISVPISNFNKWIAPASFLGFSFSGRYFLVDGVGLGFHIGYNNYYEKVGYKTYYFNSGAISASHYSYTYLVPFRMDIFYHLKPAGLVSTYIALGIGGDYQENHLLIQETDIYETTWNFLLAPEIGTIIRFDKGSSWGVRLGVNYTFTTGGITAFDLKNFQLVNFNIGVAYTVY
ncbi:MAG: hypothetical protein V1733_11625 [bacterium]